MGDPILDGWSALKDRVEELNTLKLSGDPVAVLNKMAEVNRTINDLDTLMRQATSLPDISAPFREIMYRLRQEVDTLQLTVQSALSGAARGWLTPASAIYAVANVPAGADLKALCKRLDDGELTPAAVPAAVMVATAVVVAVSSIVMAVTSVTQATSAARQARAAEVQAAAAQQQAATAAGCPPESIIPVAI